MPSILPNVQAESVQRSLADTLAATSQAVRAFWDRLEQHRPGSRAYFQRLSDQATANYNQFAPQGFHIRPPQ